MDKETLRLQMLSGIITESEYKAKLEESTPPNSSLTVGELIQKLTDLGNPNLLVGIYQDSSGDFIDVEGLEIREDWDNFVIIK